MTATPHTRALVPPDLRPSGIPRPSQNRGALISPASRVAVLLAATALVTGLALLSLAVGAKPIPLAVVVDALFAHDPTNQDHLIVTSLRLPRTVLGLLAGLALGLGGAVMQGLSRNPLADPGILGIDAGAGLAVVCAIAFLGVTSYQGYIWFSFLGAAVVSLAVYAIGSLGREGATPVKLSLAGAALTTLIGSLTGAIVLSDVDLQQALRYWAVGTLAGRSLDISAQMAPFIIGGALMALACGPALNALALGDDVARGLGQRVGRARVAAAAAVVILIGASTAAAGPVAFVGLVIPHVARLITGPDYRWALPYSMVLSPALLLVADIVGRVVVRPAELQVAIVTAAIGAPFFIWLVRRRNLAQL